MGIQYTIRNIPPAVDKTLKARAKATNKSFNQVVVEELTRVTQGGEDGSFEWLMNTMSDEDARAFDDAMAELNQPDEKFWR